MLALACAFAACDRHSAAEVPESYGHGSSHEKSYTDHQIRQPPGLAQLFGHAGLGGNQAKASPPTHSAHRHASGTADGRAFLPLRQLGVECPRGRQVWRDAFAASSCATFRCFESLEVELAPGPQFFTGDNAQGKTSILEAVCVLLRLASPRSTLLTPLVRAEVAGLCRAGPVRHAADAILLSVPSGASSRSTAWSNPGRRNISGWRGWSTSATRTSDWCAGHGGGAAAVPGFPGQRRSSHFTARTSARTSGRCGRATGCSRPCRCAGGRWRPTMHALLEAGTLLTRLRRSLVAELAPWAARAQRKIGVDDRRASGGPSLGLTNPVQRRGLRCRAVRLHVIEEARRRQTVVGPHRDDLLLNLGRRVRRRRLARRDSSVRWPWRSSSRRPICLKPSGRSRRCCCWTIFSVNSIPTVVTPCSPRCRRTRSNW